MCTCGPGGSRAERYARKLEVPVPAPFGRLAVGARHRWVNRCHLCGRDWPALPPPPPASSRPLPGQAVLPW